MTVSRIVAGSIARAIVGRGHAESFAISCCGPGGPPHSGTSFAIPAVSRRPSGPMCTLSGVNGSGRVVRNCRAGLLCENATIVCRPDEAT